MTLLEMAAEYRANALLLRERRALLCAELRTCADGERRQSFQRRIRDLTALYRESRETAAWMEHYYERGPGDRGRI